MDYETKAKNFAKSIGYFKKSPECEQEFIKAYKLYFEQEDLLKCKYHLYQLPSSEDVDNFISESKKLWHRIFDWLEIY
jgi:hypothetical protein